MVMYSYKYRLYPLPDQCVLLAKHFGATRYLYNHFLTERKEAYLASKINLNYYDNARELTEMKKSVLWLKDREWTCGGCGERHDRDLNAAKMILKQGRIQNKLPLERRKVKRKDTGRTPVELTIGCG